jgi:EAL domain-containing protein (putative c-di-GMP-specific phosphodiesterase class I)
MDEEARRRRLLDLDLRRALQAGGEFEIYYQPVVHAASRKLTGMEALVRWQHPIHGLIGPNEFIPLAEEVGLIVPLGEFVLRMACKEAASWPAGLRLAVNLSLAQFRQPRMLEMVKEALDDAGMSPRRLELEVTEALLLEDAEGVRRILRSLQASGIQIALDDFGTGYSSLSYLHNFPFDRVKIDKSFVRDVDTRPRSASILRAVTSMAAALNMAVTAEGVETEAEHALLVAAGCTEMQGFMFSRPRPVAEIREMITTVGLFDPATD